MLTYAGSFFFGLFSYIAFEYSWKIGDVVTHDEGTVYFIDNYELDTKSNYQKSLTVIYWVCTTFTSVGLGDYYPQNNFERMGTVIYFVLGKILFTYILSNFSEAV